MVQALPRYCLRCSAPTQSGMLHCPSCRLPLHSLLQGADLAHFQAGDDAIPASERFQFADVEGLSEGSLACPPRFSPASPFPPAPAEETDLTPLVPLSPPPPPGSPLPIEPEQGPDLPSSPDTLALSSSDTPLQGTDTGQLEADASVDPAFHSSSAPTPAVDEEVLPEGQHPSPASGKLAPPLPPEPGKWNGTRGRWTTRIAFIILAVLLIFAGLGGYIAFSGHLSSWNSSQVTPQATSIHRAIDAPATATARTAPTNPYVSGGTLVFSDTLKAANANWDQNTGCAFKDGSYHVTATTIQSCTLKANVTLTNFVLEVKATLLQGDVGGFFFRENKLRNKSNAYLIDFDSKGSYQLWNYSASSDATLIDYGVSSILRAGYNQTNTIALVVQGPSITLYINGQVIKHFFDDTYSSGGLSLMSSEYSPHTGASEAAYSDLRLWRL